MGAGRPPTIYLVKGKQTDRERQTEHAQAEQERPIAAKINEIKRISPLDAC